MCETVAILGVGLIGGSLALSFKERTCLRVIGFDLYEEDLAFAKAAGAIDEGYTKLLPAVQDADYIFIALPVDKIKQAIHSLTELPLKPNVMISDVGSTKAEIVQKGRALNQQGITFIGGHPMAGSHRSGFKAAHSLLFENAYYVLTPDPDTPNESVEQLRQLIEKATKAQVVLMDAEEHDRVVGAISHLPHIIASGLVYQVGKYSEENEWFHRLAAGGFRDLTRIASSHPIMWRDILLSNVRELVPLMDDWIEQMKEFQLAIIRRDAEKIEHLFDRARRLRDQLPDRKKGIIVRTYACYLDVPDRPGVIADIATHLANEEINLSNIGVLENREDAPGILQLTFRQEEDYRRAVQCLRSKGYIVFTNDEKEEKDLVSVK
ncbi:prephenate dehydrogenase [Thermoflavimicrobium dichotomicum]|uniref:Prephenate dehydrogenase n=1 Tax=Thermoflavimicrobium dichotomicum TaxID=46223 RepID=A0A1I3SMF9_9BACL|nr:prephenate dehydrogenase [Thermoflavimicrobium dichotomicum]SFJ58616.1 prephenate dehydrogenase [Thermoflavimicrobium dichotomicum]